MQLDGFLIVTTALASLAGLIGFAMLHEIAGNLRRQLRRRQWAQTNGTVISCGPPAAEDVSPSEAANDHEPPVRFTYEVDGVPFEADKVTHGDVPGMTRAEAAHFARLLVPGRDVDVFYDPSSPADAALLPCQTAWHPLGIVTLLVSNWIALCIGTALLGLGVAWWYGLYTGTPMTERLRSALPADSRLRPLLDEFSALTGLHRDDRDRPEPAEPPDGVGGGEQAGAVLRGRGDEPPGLQNPETPSVLKTIDLSGNWHIRTAAVGNIIPIELVRLDEVSYEFTSKMIVNVVGTFRITGGQLVKVRRPNDNYWDMTWTWRDGYFEMTSGNYRGSVMFRPGQERP